MEKYLILFNSDAVYSVVEFTQDMVVSTNDNVIVCELLKAKNALLHIGIDCGKIDEKIEEIKNA